MAKPNHVEITQRFIDGNHAFTFTTSGDGNGADFDPGAAFLTAHNNLTAQAANARYSNSGPEKKTTRVQTVNDSSAPNFAGGGANAAVVYTFALKSDATKLLKINFPYFSTSLRLTNKDVDVESDDYVDVTTLLMDKDGVLLTENYDLVSAKFKK